LYRKKNKQEVGIEMNNQEINMGKFEDEELELK
jgi:hypothetical protein